MDTYASKSLNTISYISPANRNVFPKLCNAAGWTDVDAYCAKGTEELCCGLCPNTNVNGPGQFIWAIVSYGIAAVAYTLAPSEVWGVAVMQNLNAHAFIMAGMIRVLAGAETGAMAKYMTQFLWPQALGFVFIMSPAILAPQWSKVGKTRADMERKLYRRHKRLPHQASREHLREVEKTLLKKHHTTWGWPIFTFWFLSMITWTILFIYVNHGGLRFYQSNCEGKLNYTLSPNVATCILGGIAWALLAFDGWLLMQKPENRLGGSDYIIEHWLPRKTRSAGEHRRLERRITIGVTGFLFLLWLVLNLWLYIEGLNRFLLSGADFITFGQVEQLTALFPDFLALYLGIHGYLKSRDELRETRERLTATEASRRNSSRASSESQPRLSGETYRASFDLPRPPTIGSFKDLKRDSFWHNDNLNRIITGSSTSDPDQRGRHASVPRASGADPNPEIPGSNNMHNLRHRSRSSGRPTTFGRTSFATLTPQPEVLENTIPQRP